MDNDPVSEQLLNQRVRNRIMDYLEVAGSPSAQRDYELQVPIAQVPNEMIEQWADWVDPDAMDGYNRPVFSRDENEAIRRFHEVWRAVVNETPATLPHTVDLLIGTAVWERLISAAQAALAVFKKRGRFDEDAEERFEG